MAPPSNHPLTYSTVVASDLAFNLKATHPSGVFFCHDSTGVLPPRNYWLTDRTLWQDVCTHFSAEGFDSFTFAPYSSKAAFINFYPNIHLDANELFRQETTTPAPAAANVSRDSTSPQQNTTHSQPRPFGSPQVGAPAPAASTQFDPFAFTSMLDNIMERHQRQLDRQEERFERYASSSSKPNWTKRRPRFCPCLFP